MKETIRKETEKRGELSKPQPRRKTRKRKTMFPGRDIKSSNRAIMLSSSGNGAL